MRLAEQTPFQVLTILLDEPEWSEKLTDQQREAFEDMRSKVPVRGPRTGRLSEKQARWVMNVAAAVGLIGAAPAENVFSALSPERQAEQRRAAARVKLPWET